MPFQVKRLKLSGMTLIQHKVYSDERGFFAETFQAKKFETASLPTYFVQENHSGSHRGTLRGLHYQQKHVQGKLIHVVAGSIYDVAVDIRKNSTTYGQWEGIQILDKDHMGSWIPPGFAHGFYVLSEWAEIMYKTTDHYAPEWERTLAWDDPDLNIDWPLMNDIPPIISKKDLQGKKLREIEPVEIE